MLLVEMWGGVEVWFRSFVENLEVVVKTCGEWLQLVMVGKMTHHMVIWRACGWKEFLNFAADAASPEWIP